MKPGFFQITLKVFLRKGGAFLVLKDAESGFGDLPGGRLGQGEIYDPFPMCIDREIKEELGDIKYLLREKPLFYFPHRILNGGHEALGIAFLAEYQGGEIRLSEEHNQMSWENVEAYHPGELFKDHLLYAVEHFQRMLKAGTL